MVMNCLVGLLVVCVGLVQGSSELILGKVLSKGGNAEASPQQLFLRAKFSLPVTALSHTHSSKKKF